MNLDRIARRLLGMRTATAVVAALIVVFETAVPSLHAQARTLNWPLVSVTAHLDADGGLEVSEQQVMQFSGSWNGGERVFNLRFGQKIDLDGLYRVDSATGSEQPMRAGDLSEVDEYDWANSTTLRWRSRKTSDPPFNRTTITHVLKYAYSNILIPQDDGSILLVHNNTSACL